MARGKFGKLAVIGLGYVGLPLALEASRVGWSVVGIDTSGIVVEGLNSGRSHVDDVTDEDVQLMLHEGFMATSQADALNGAHVVVICVPTPLTRDGAPDLRHVNSAVDTVARGLQPGQLVVLESTTYPGTTEEVVLPRLAERGLEVGVDFYCAFSPERVDPGNPVFSIRNTPKVVGGVTPTCTDKASSFYATFVTSIVQAKGPREAEMTKLLENTYRHVNIALMNEMVKFSHLMDIDLWDVIRCASTKPFGFEGFKPGPGVGGHCIPIDPNYLSYKIRANLGQPFRFVELAEEINRGMPNYVVHRSQQLLNGAGQAVRGARVLILGVTYKSNVADLRESPSLAVAEGLCKLGALVSFHDPFFDEWRVNGISIRREDDWKAAMSNVDLTLLLQAHSCYDELGAGTGHRVLDTRGVVSGDHVDRL